MKLTVLNSGSRANGYILQNEQEALVIECGVPLSDCLKALDYNSSKVVACLVTHEHGDHCKYIESYIERMPVYCSNGTHNTIKYKGQRKPETMTAFRKYQFGGFTVTPFDTQHDCAEPFGYMIKHDDLGRLVFATDTYYLQYTFAGFNHFMIECNYDKKLLNDNIAKGLVPKFVLDRVKKSHMSLEQCIETIKANDLSQIVDVVLLHISRENGDAEMFQKAVESSVGVRTFVARKGLEIELNKTPF